MWGLGFRIRGLGFSLNLNSKPYHIQAQPYCPMAAFRPTQTMWASPLLQRDLAELAVHSCNLQRSSLFGFIRLYGIMAKKPEIAIFLFYTLDPEYLAPRP